MTRAIVQKERARVPFMSVIWPNKKYKTDQPVFAENTFNNLDEKTERMLQFFVNEEFKTTRVTNHMHLRLAIWAIENKFNAYIKRAFDIAVSSIALACLSPIIAVTALAIKLDSPGPVFFKQTRVGKRGRQFSCYKFRSMVPDAENRKKDLMEQNEADEIVFKMKKDPRITRVGRFIRKYSIDELPQLFNVLRGDMSIVGPRPPVPLEVQFYQYDQYYRLDAVPGITGLQQVEGRSDITFKRWVELDLLYIQEQSFLNDLWIILKTIPAVITAKGAY
jgi:exopolysaccharide biosynthesis polyprenyl glycosylphosphotransferase